MGGYARSLNACETRVTNAGALVPPQVITYNAGVGELYLAAPGASNGGSVVLTANLGVTGSGNYCPTVGGTETAVSGANRAYLQGNWNGSATYNQDPQARAAFGIYGSQPRQLIFQRENY
jgi:hypothetical protein